MDPTEHLKEQIEESANYIAHQTSLKPEIGIILGSGMEQLVSTVQNKLVFPYEEVPYFPVCLTSGHRGNLVLGSIDQKEVAVMEGRAHIYEGYTVKGVTFPIRVLKKLGVKILIITNAASALSKVLSLGDIMLITDHINLMKDNPLVGPDDPVLGPRFVDLSQAYDKGLVELAKKVAREEKINIRTGVYVGVTGPSLETPSEARFLQKIGGDAVGMSTVAEVIVAVQSGMRVLAFSIITNLLEGGRREINQNKIMEKAKKSAGKLIALIKGCIRKI